MFKNLIFISFATSCSTWLLMDSTEIHKVLDIDANMPELLPFEKPRAAAMVVEVSSEPELAESELQPTSLTMVYQETLASVQKPTQDSILSKVPEKADMFEWDPSWEKVNNFATTFIDPFGFWSSIAEVGSQATEVAYYAGIMLTLCWNLLWIGYGGFLLFKVTSLVGYCLNKLVRLSCCWVNKSNTRRLGQWCCSCCKQRNSQASETLPLV